MFDDLEKEIISRKEDISIEERKVEATCSVEILSNQSSSEFGDKVVDIVKESKEKSWVKAENLTIKRKGNLDKAKPANIKRGIQNALESFSLNLPKYANVYAKTVPSVSACSNSTTQLISNGELYGHRAAGGGGVRSNFTT